MTNEPKTIAGPTGIWACKIGETKAALPAGADAPMRAAVERAYRELTGEQAAFTISGWSAELTEGERAVVENRLPQSPNTAPAELPEALPRYREYMHLRTTGAWSSGVPAWARDYSGCMNDMTAAHAVIEELHAKVEALGAAQAGAPAEAPLPLLVRDIAADLNTTPIQVCKALAELGFGGHSVNMAVTPQMARSLRSHFAAAPRPSPSPAPAQPGQEGERLEILAPNASGNASCIVRWLIETPQGWVGAWNTEALEYLIARAAPQPAPVAQGGAVLAYLDGLSDDAAAHIFPDDLRRCSTSECTATVYSVRVGSPDGKTVPLYSREQVAAAIAAQKGGRDD